MFFRVSVPKYGSVHVQAPNAGLARIGVQRFLSKQGNSGYEIGAAFEVSSIPLGADLINSSGNLIFLPPPSPPAPPATEDNSDGSHTPSNTGGDSPTPAGPGGDSAGSGEAESPSAPTAPTGGSQGSFGEPSTPGEDPQDPYRGLNLPTGFFDSGDLPLIVKYFNSSGSLAVVGVTGIPEGVTLDELGRLLPPGSTIYDTGTLPGYFLKGDADLVERWRTARASGISTASQFIQSLGVFDFSGQFAEEEEDKEEEPEENDGNSGEENENEEQDDAGDNLPAPSGFWDDGKLPDGSVLPFVVKLTVNGDSLFLKAASSDYSLVKQAAESRFGDSVTVRAVSTASYFQNDPEFLSLIDSIGGQGLTHISQFLDKLGTLSLTSSGGGTGGGTGSDTGGGDQGTTGDGTFSDDLQDFPLATYLNAVEDLGFNPNGVLQSILTNRFYNLNPALNIGKALGTIDPGGNAVGTLGGQYQDLFGNRSISGDVFRDLLAAEASGNPDISLSKYITPNFGGSNNASEVLALARAAAAERYGSFFANNVLPSFQQLTTEYERLIAEANGEPEESFLNFARRQHLLPVDF